MVEGERQRQHAMRRDFSLFRDYGTPLDAARHMIYFRLSADADQFLTMAKFRALRKLWAS